MSSIKDAAPEDFKSALKKKWSGAPAAKDYYDWTKDSSYPVFGDWEPKSNKKKVAACEQPQLKEIAKSFSAFLNLMEVDRPIPEDPEDINAEMETMIVKGERFSPRYMELSRALGVAKKASGMRAGEGIGSTPISQIRRPEEMRYSGYPRGLQ